MPNRYMPCQGVSTPVEYTICNNDNLRCLNDVLYYIYQKVLFNNNTQEVYQKHLDWLKVRNSFTTDGCIERAYYQGITLLSDVDNKFDWAGNWWNLTATNGSGGNIQINEVSQWTACMNSNIWAGINHGSYRAEIRKTAGLGIFNHIADTRDCKLLLISLNMIILRFIEMLIGAVNCRFRKMFLLTDIILMRIKIRGLKPHYFLLVFLLKNIWINCSSNW